MNRRPDWLQRLHAYIEAVRRRPMHAVDHNCALFAAGAVHAMTDHDPVHASGIRRPKSATDVARILVEAGGVIGLAQQFFGVPPTPPLTASRGDVMIKPGDGGDTLGVCMGDHALFLAADGLQSRRIDECTGCWHVPGLGT